MKWTDFLNTTNFDARFSAEILDINGNIVQSNMPSPSFISAADPALQFTDGGDGEQFLWRGGEQVPSVMSAAAV